MEKNSNNMKIYVASKIKHRDKWLKMRDSGYNIISRWIDYYGDNNQQFVDICIDDLNNCDALLLFIDNEDEILKGAFVEFGVALGLNKKIFVVCKNPNSIKHKNLFFVSEKVKISDNLEDILKYLR